MVKMDSLKCTVSNPLMRMFIPATPHGGHPPLSSALTNFVCMSEHVSNFYHVVTRSSQSASLPAFLQQRRHLHAAPQQAAALGHLPPATADTGSLAFLVCRSVGGWQRPPLRLPHPTCLIRITPSGLAHSYMPGKELALLLHGQGVKSSSVSTQPMSCSGQFYRVHSTVLQGAS
jgi:hypothetical protein